MIVFLRNRLKYALTYDEVKKITYQRLIKVDGKVRTDMNFPTGFMGKYASYMYWERNYGKKLDSTLHHILHVEYIMDWKTRIFVEQWFVAAKY